MIQRLAILVPLLGGVAFLLSMAWILCGWAWFCFIVVTLVVLFLVDVLRIGHSYAGCMIDEQLARDRECQRKVLRFQHVERRRRV